MGGLYEGRKDGRIPFAFGTGAGWMDGWIYQVAIDIDMEDLDLGSLGAIGLG